MSNTTGIVSESFLEYPAGDVHMIYLCLEAMND